MQNHILIIKVCRIIYFIGLACYLTFFGWPYGEVIFSHLTGVINGGSELSLTLLFNNVTTLIITYLAISCIYHFITGLIIGNWDYDDFPH